MEFKKFLEMISETEVTEAKKKKPDADGDGVPDWADKKPGKDDHADDKKKDKKKSLKDWIEETEKKVISEQQVTKGYTQPLKIQQGSSPAFTITDPSTKSTITTTNPSVVDAAKRGQLQVGKQLEEEDVEESGLQAYLGKKKYGKEGMAALQKAGREGASKEKMAQIRAKHDKLDEVEKSNFWVHDQEENEYYGPYSSESSAREGGRVGPKAKIVKHPASVRNPRTLNRTATSQANAAKVKSAGAYGKAMEGQLDEKWAGDAKVKPTGEYKDKSEAELKSMLAKLKKSGPHDKDSPAAKKQRQINFALRAKGGWKSGEGAAMKEEQLDEKAVSKKQQKFMGMVHAAQKGEKPASKAVADVAKSMKKGDVKDFAKTKHKGLPEKKKKMKEADIPPHDSNASPMVQAPLSESKIQVNESMNKLEAAFHQGKHDGLKELACRVKHYEDMDEAKKYYEGWKQGLDECYGMSEGVSMPQSVPAMANAALPSVPAMEGDMDEGNAFGQAVRAAKADGIQPGEKITVGGKSYPVKEEDAFAFESLDKQLNDLLKEDTQIVNEGLSVNMSQGLGGMGEDTVSVSATGDDASRLLDFIKQVGLGGLGGSSEGMAHGEPAVVAVSDYGAPQYSGHDGMAALMKKVGVDDHHDDYKDEADHEHSDSCGCKVDEVESPDQMLYNVAEDDGEGYEQSQADAGKIDAALALSGASKGGATNEGGDGGEASEEPVMSEESKSEEDDKAEKAGEKVAKDIEDDEDHKGKDDEKAEEAGDKVKKDIEYDDKKDEEEKDKDKEKVDEWANDAGKKGTDAAFEEDINFMTKVISGGLNKPKSTGQTTIPVIAGQEQRMGVSEDAEVTEWKRLAGLR